MEAAEEVKMEVRKRAVRWSNKIGSITLSLLTLYGLTHACANARKMSKSMTVTGRRDESRGIRLTIAVNSNLRAGRTSCQEYHDGERLDAASETMTDTMDGVRTELLIHPRKRFRREVDPFPFLFDASTLPIRPDPLIVDPCLVLSLC